MDPVCAPPCDDRADDLPILEANEDDPAGDGHRYGSPETWGWWTDVFYAVLADAREDGDR